MRIGVSIGLSGGGLPINRSSVAFTDGPTVAEVFDTWNVAFASNSTIIISGAPAVTIPTATFGSSNITIIG